MDFQIDGLSNSESEILGFLEGDGGNDIPSPRRIAEALRRPENEVVDDLLVLEQSGLVQSIRPDHFPVARGRFQLSDMGRSALAGIRRRTRMSERKIVETSPEDPTEFGRAMDNESSSKRGVFVVHGRDIAFANALTEFLRSADLRPLEWDQAVILTGKASPYVGEVIEAALKVVQAIIIAMTPDNIARLRPELCGPNEPTAESSFGFHPRQNVIFEAGMAFAIAPDRTIIVVPSNVILASDIGGRNFVSFSGDPDSRNKLLGRLEIAGCEPNKTGTDWLKAGNFPNYSSLSVDLKNTAVVARPNASDEPKPIDERLFMVQPTLTIKLHPSMGGPAGHFLSGTLGNVGRGIARNVILRLPGIWTERIASVIEVKEQVAISAKYSDFPCFLEELSDNICIVEFEDEQGTIYRQEGEVQQKLSSGGSIWLYNIDSLGPPSIAKARTLASISK